MPVSLSPRLLTIVNALPLKTGMRVLEIGCGPGAMAREIVRRIGDGHVLAIDRSARAIAQARAASRAEISDGRLCLRHLAIEDFALEPGEQPYDLAVAIRVGVLDGRHPQKEREALRQVAGALTPKGRLFIDRATSVREIQLRSSPSRA